MTEKKFGQPISMQLLVARTLFGIEAAIMMLAGVFDIIIGLSPNITTNFLLFQLSGTGSVLFGTVVGIIGLAGLVLSFTVRKPSPTKVNAVYIIMACFLLLMLLEGSFGYFAGFLAISAIAVYLLWREMHPEEHEAPAPVPSTDPAPAPSNAAEDTPTPPDSRESGGNSEEKNDDTDTPPSE